jgi:hypothetical protein
LRFGRESFSSFASFHPVPQSAGIFMEFAWNFQQKGV